MAFAEEAFAKATQALGQVLACTRSGPADAVRQSPP